MYEPTRHNVGFWFIDALAGLNSLVLHKPFFKPWASASTMLANGHRLTLVKPHTFMNLSGDIFAENVDFCPGPDRQLLIACDQMDLSPGCLRLKSRGGTAGHNGLKSINARIGQDFYPLYIGIGRPPLGVEVVDYVLGIPQAEEYSAINGALERAQLVVDLLLTEGIERTMNETNRKDHAEKAHSPD